MNKVALIHCQQYEREAVQKAVDAIFDQCGGIQAFIKPRMRVLIKLNLLMKRTPDKATTTHPEVARAVALAVMRGGGIPVFADSPGGPYTQRMLSGVYEICGISTVAAEIGCALNDDFTTTTRYYEDGHVAKHLDLIGLIDHVDAVITVGKLKTHGLTTMTGCVKNLYGLVPGTKKVEYHARYQDVRLFSQMLVDICGCVKPCFAILDAVIGMEGEGPSGGEPRVIGALLGGCDAHQVDEAGARLIGLMAEQVTTLAAAKKRGVLKPYVMTGDPPEPLILHDFCIPMKLRRTNWLHAVNHMPQVLRPRPVFRCLQCDGCGTCMRACPAGAITLDESRCPHVDLKKCIRCFCCQELCPKTDIEVWRPFVFHWMK